MKPDDAARKAEPVRQDGLSMLQEYVLLCIEEYEDAIENAEDTYIGSHQALTVSDLRSMDERFHEKGLIAMLYALDNATELSEGDPGFFCVDYYIDAIDERDLVEDIIDSDCITARDIVEWIDARRKQEELKIETSDARPIAGQFELPPVEPFDGRLLDCAVCGATASAANPESEYLYPSGMLGMYHDVDLCEECAIHVWRALREARPAEYAQIARDLLRRYSVTKDHVPREATATVTQ